MGNLLRRVSLLFVAATLLLGAPAFAAEGAPATKASLQEMYVNYLKAEGYMPKVDKDGDVVFKREGKTYFVQVSAKDPKFFRLIFPSFWKIESPAERLRAFKAAEISNRGSKVSKIFIVNDNTWASVELFFEKPEDFKGVFKRCVPALQNGVQNYVKAMRASKAAVEKKLPGEPLK